MNALRLRLAVSRLALLAGAILLFILSLATAGALAFVLRIIGIALFLGYLVLTGVVRYFGLQTPAPAPHEPVTAAAIRRQSVIGATLVGSFALFSAIAFGVSIWFPQIELAARITGFFLLGIAILTAGAAWLGLTRMRRRLAAQTPASS